MFNRRAALSVSPSPRGSVHYFRACACTENEYGLRHVRKCAAPLRYRALLIKDDEDVQIRPLRQGLDRDVPGIATSGRRQKIKQIVLDGELVALGEDGRPSFQALQHRSSHQNHQIVFYVFDVLYAGGQDLTGERLDVRRARLPRS